MSLSRRLSQFRRRFDWQRSIAALVAVAFSMTVVIPLSHAELSISPASGLAVFSECVGGVPVDNGENGQPHVAHCSCHFAIPQEADARPPARESVIIRSPLQASLVPAPDSSPLPKPPRA